MIHGRHVELPTVRLWSGRSCKFGLADVARPQTVLVRSDDTTTKPGWRAGLQLTRLAAGTNALDLIIASGPLVAVLPGLSEDSDWRPVPHGDCDVRSGFPEGLRIRPASHLAATEATGRRVRGVVRSSTESSLEEAFVWVEPRPPMARSLGRLSTVGPLEPFRRSNGSHFVPEVARTDDQGRFSVLVPDLSTPPKEPWAVTAWSPGYLPVRRVVGENTALALALSPAGVLEGRVTDERGHSVSGATVGVVDPLPHEIAGALVPSATMTDAEGRYQLTELPTHEDLRVEVYKQEFTSAAVGVFLAPEQEKVRRRDFVLVRESWVVGRLTGPSGEAIAGAELVTVNRDLAYLVHGAPSRWRMAKDLTIASSNAEGRFRVKLPGSKPESRALVAAAPGWTTHTLPLVGREVGQSRIDVGTVVLRPGERFTGIVLGTEGRLVDQPRVLFSRAGLETPPALPVGVPSALLNPAEAEVSGGHFTIEGLRRGDVLNLHVTATGYLPSRIVGLRVEDAPVEVHLQPGVAVSIRVEDEAGAPRSCSALVMVRLGRTPSGALARKEDCKPGPEQRVVGLEPGDYDLRISSPETEMWRRSVSVSSFERENSFVARLEPLAALVQGQVWSESGPLGGARVRIGSEMSESSEDGRFSLRVRSGRQVIYVERADTGLVSSRILELERGENEVLLDLSSRVFSGALIDAEGGAVDRASVALRSSESVDTYRTFTSADGGFSLSVVPGTYDVLVRSASGDLDDSVDLLRGSISGRLLRLEDLGQLRIHVLGLAPDEVAHVVWSRTPLSPDGSVRFWHGNEAPMVSIAPGRWFFSATGEATRRRGFQVVDVEVGRHSETVELRLGDDGVVGSVTIDGHEASGVSVFLVAEGAGNVRSVISGAGGRFEFLGVTAGSYHLSTETTVVSLEVPTSRAVALDVATVAVGIGVNEHGADLPVSGADLELWPARVERSVAARLGMLRRYVTVAGSTWIARLPSGAYRARVSGAGLEETETLIVAEAHNDVFLIDVKRRRSD